MRESQETFSDVLPVAVEDPYELRIPCNGAQGIGQGTAGGAETYRKYKGL